MLMTTCTCARTCTHPQECLHAAQPFAQSAAAAAAAQAPNATHLGAAFREHCLASAALNASGQCAAVAAAISQRASLGQRAAGLCWSLQLCSTGLGTGCTIMDAGVGPADNRTSADANGTVPSNPTTPALAAPDLNQCTGALRARVWCAAGACVVCCGRVCGVRRARVWCAAGACVVCCGRVCGVLRACVWCAAGACVVCGGRVCGVRRARVWCAAGACVVCGGRVCGVRRAHARVQRAACCGQRLGLGLHRCAMCCVAGVCFLT
jgi:hypothetical protein